MRKSVLKLFLIPVIGIAVSVVGFILVFTGMTDKSIAVLAVPGEQPFEISEPGTYVVWQTTTAVENGMFVTRSAELPAGMAISMINVDTQSTVPLTHKTDTTMSSGLQQKQSLFSADLSPGHFKLVARGRVSEPVTLEVTKDISLGKIGLLFGVVALGSVITIAGLAIIVVQVIRYWIRSNAEKS